MDMASPGKRQRTYDAIAALLRVSELVERRRRQLARSAGLSDQQWRVLEEIHTEDFMPSLFARNRETSPAAISRTLRQLQERGLVRAAISTADARQRTYALTARGRRAIERLHAARENALEAIWDPFPAAEIDTFVAFATGLANRLEAYAAEVESSGSASARV